MKPFGLLGTAVLFSILGMTATVSAQQDDRDKPAQAPAHEDQAAPPQENRAPDAKPAQQDEKRTQQKDEKRTQQDDKQVQDQEKRESKDNKQAQDQEKREPKNDKQQPRDDNRAQQDKNHPQMKQDQDAHRAGNGGGRIPDDKFRSHFGREHHFRVSRPTVVSGQPRFEYGGFSFIMVDPWPVGWDYADDCYIDYVDGEYLLFDLAHPGVTIVVNVVL